ncbi:3287_t:CDS:1, partial [Racocetra persica]
SSGNPKLDNRSFTRQGFFLIVISHQIFVVVFSDAAWETNRRPLDCDLETVPPSYLYPESDQMF